MRKTKRGNKGVRAYSLGGIILLVLLVVVLVGCGALSVSLPKCADNGGAAVSSVKNGSSPIDGVESNSSKDLGYYMFFPWFDFSLFVSKSDFDTSTVIFVKSNYVKFLESLGADFWGRNEVVANFCLRFEDVTVFKDAHDEALGIKSPLLVNLTTYLEIPSRLYKGDEFVFRGVENSGELAENKKDIKVNMRKEFYEVFKEHENSFGRITVMLMGGSKAYPLYSSRSFKDTYISNYPSPYLKVGDPDDYPWDNGGTWDTDTDNGKDKSWLEILYDFLKDLFSWTIPYSTFKSWFVGIFAVIIGGFLLGLIVKFLKWIF